MSRRNDYESCSIRNEDRRYNDRHHYRNKDDEKEKCRYRKSERDRDEKREDNRIRLHRDKPKHHDSPSRETHSRSRLDNHQSRTYRRSRSPRRNTDFSIPEAKPTVIAPQNLEEAALQALQQEVAPKPKESKGLIESKPKQEEEVKPIVKEKVNFATSGKLAEDTNMFNGVIVNYSEPPEAKKPSKKWRLYPFKGDDPLPHIEIHTQSAFLLGRDRRVVDIPIDHPSCSKQHAAIQFRVVTFEKEDATVGKRIRPYLMDLDSANGSYINSKRIDPRRYYELLEKDVIKFGFSSREYVVLTEEAKN